MSTLVFMVTRVRGGDDEDQVRAAFAACVNGTCPLGSSCSVCPWPNLRNSPPSPCTSALSNPQEFAKYSRTSSEGTGYGEMRGRITSIQGVSEGNGGENVLLSVGRRRMSSAGGGEREHVVDERSAKDRVSVDHLWVEESEVGGRAKEGICEGRTPARGMGPC